MSVPYQDNKGICHPDNQGAILSCLDNNRRLIYIILFLVVVGGVTTVIVLSSKDSTTSTNSCEKYAPDSLASSVTKECLKQIWKNANCQPVNDFPSWWTSSPQGGKTVLCDPNRPDYPCGAGNFGAIINGMTLCRINYQGR